MRLRHSVLVLVLHLSLISCGQAQKTALSRPLLSAGYQNHPSWIFAGEQAEFPREFYLTAVGEGPTKEMADKGAMVMIAEQIRVSIQSELHLKTRSQTVGERSEYSKDLSRSVETSVDLKGISGISIVKHFFDQEKSEHYSLAILDRNVASFALKKEIAALFKDTDNYLRIANGHKAKVEISQAVFNLQKALNHLEKGEQKNRILFTISGEAIPPPHLHSAIQGEMFEIVSHLKLEPVSGNNQKGKPGAGLPAPLVLKALFFNGSAAVPVRGLELSFTLESPEAGLIQTPVVTDAHGVGKSIVIRLLPTGKKNNFIPVSVRFEDQALVSSGPTFNFNYTLPVRADIKVAVEVREKNLNRPLASPLVGPILIRHLSNRGYNVVLTEPSGEDVDYSVTGELNTAKKGEYSGIISALVLGEVRIVDMESQAVLTTVDPKNSKGMGSSLDAAGIDALKRAGARLGAQLADELDRIFNGKK